MRNKVISLYISRTGNIQPRPEYIGRLISFWSIALAVVATACSHGGGLPETGTEAIGFRSAVEKTRALETDAATIQDFRVWARWNVSVPFMDEVKVTRSGNDWTYNPLFYWPVEGSLDFYAYSPAASTGVRSIDISANSQTVEIVYDATTDCLMQEDFMVASALNRTYTTPTVPMDFRHVLSQVAFQAKSSEAGIIYRVRGISLQNLSRSRTLVGTAISGIPDWNWTDNGTPAPTDAYPIYLPDTIELGIDYKSLTYTEVGNLMIIPQSAENLKIAITYDSEMSDGTPLRTNATAHLPVHATGSSTAPFIFEMGARYTFKLDLNEETLTVI